MLSQAISPGELIVDLVFFLRENIKWLFDGIRIIIDSMVSSSISGLNWLPPAALIIIVALAAWRTAGKKVALFSVLGLGAILWMGLWTPTIQTLCLVIVATLIAVVVGIPLGILKARSKKAGVLMEPVLDFMQTLPTLIYLIPAVLLFRIGNVPGVVATIIFAMPPAIRLTSHGIEQVSNEMIEVGRAFGCSSKQLLFKIELPLALPSIMVGINQTIMLSFSMVVIAGFIGAAGLQKIIISGITRYNLAPAIDAGLAIVILAIIIDRTTRLDQGSGSGRPIIRQVKDGIRYVASLLGSSSGSRAKSSGRK
ncbi:MAG: ABC transporter permease subunit [Candidatus Woesearchaeota archaeon]